VIACLREPDSFLLPECVNRLINTSNYSINALAEIIVGQVAERVAAAVSSYTGKCKLSVTEPFLAKTITV
jgi:hypothetical protein